MTDARTEFATQPPHRRARAWHAAALAVPATVLVLAATVPGLAHKPNPADAVSDALARNQIGPAISAGEAALANAPRDGSLRAALGHAYLRAGRFESAAAVLADAQALGDSSPRTALTLALAESATGKGHDAIEVLDNARAGIPAADYGLALALAGDSTRGVAVLDDALKAGDQSPRLRQNLAYAYALDGRWGAARNVAASDLPADKLDGRITGWAATAGPQAYRERVAALVGAPVQTDAGLPAALALNTAPAAAPQMADAAPVPAAEPIALAAEVPAAVPAPHTTAAASFIAQPVVQALPARTAYAPRPVRTHAIPVHAIAKPLPRLAAAHWLAKPHAALALAHGNRAVQLGAYSTKAVALWARGRFAHYGAFAHHGFVVTHATVGGRGYWRLAVTGFSDPAARSTCANLRSHGSVCFALAMPRVGAPALAMVRPAAKGVVKTVVKMGGSVAHARRR